ncbi:MAG: hypothetical protein L0271_13090, partial [Gemmatimonadetes bacterium]|nr:hypothetical protein [Gemmatimonadota bacterium]
MAPEAMRAAGPAWMKWSDLPWFSRSDAAGAAIQLCERLLQASLELDGVKAFLHEQLPEIATEVSAQLTAVVRRTPEWKTLGACGHH